ncbi:MAG: diguanylate cyclase [Thermodesulfobacteriota bacterium]|nr:diguanylate cyclase [Thermodesulfobacteriota bacterium]
MRVLIADDDPVARRMLEGLLGKCGYDVLSTRDGREALEELQKPDGPSLVISDWMMPGMDGLELCRKSRELDRSDYIYFIILTTKGEKEDTVQGLEAGADDYLVKPFNQEELRCRVKIGERILDLERRILQLASTDTLTGALNRRVFIERMETEIYRAGRQSTPFSLLMVDIDHFKEINDRFGHQAGDLVLERFVKRLSESVRPYDFLGRYGGEEFVLGLAGADVVQATTIAERMRKGIEEMNIGLADGQESIHITASFGVASVQLGSEETVDSLTWRADEAMYRAKAGGRNRVCAASEK